MGRLRFDPTINAGAVMQAVMLVVVIGGGALAAYDRIRDAMHSVREVQARSVDETRRLSDAVAALTRAVSPIPQLELRMDRAEQRLDASESRDAAQDERIGIIDRSLAETRGRLDRWTTPPVRSIPR